MEVRWKTQHQHTHTHITNYLTNVNTKKIFFHLFSLSFFFTPSKNDQTKIKVVRNRRCKVKQKKKKEPLLLFLLFFFRFFPEKLRADVEILFKKERNKNTNINTSS